MYFFGTMCMYDVFVYYKISSFFGLCMFLQVRYKYAYVSCDFVLYYKFVFVCKCPSTLGLGSRGGRQTNEEVMGMRGALRFQSSLHCQLVGIHGCRNSPNLKKKNSLGLESYIRMPGNSLYNLLINTESYGYISKQ